MKNLVKMGLAQGQLKFVCYLRSLYLYLSLGSLAGDTKRVVVAVAATGRVQSATEHVGVHGKSRGF